MTILRLQSLERFYSLLKTANKSNQINTDRQDGISSSTQDIQFPPWIHTEKIHLRTFMLSPCKLPPLLTTCPDQPVLVMQWLERDWQCCHLWALPTLFAVQAEPDVPLPGTEAGWKQVIILAPALHSKKDQGANVGFVLSMFFTL